MSNQFKPKDTAMKPTGRFLTLFDVVITERTMMKKSKAVVRIVLFMKRTMQRRGYLLHSRMSVNMQTSLVMKPKTIFGAVSEDSCTSERPPSCRKLLCKAVSGSVPRAYHE